MRLRVMFLLGCLCLGAASALASPTLVLLVRHAETEPDGTRDPGLSKAGTARARTLAERMCEVGVTHVFTSQFRRTMETGAATAETCRAKAEIIDAQSPEVLLKTIRDLPPGSVVLVVGHSNTVPDLATRLGAPDVQPMPETEYDRLITIRFESGAAARTTVDRYGE